MNKKTNNPRPRSSVSLLTTAAMLVIIFLIWRPVLFGERPNLSPVSISESAFIPVDSNAYLTDSKSRLILVTGFHAAKLDNDRSLYVYLPHSYYEETGQRYPVLYVNDGGTVFEKSGLTGESLGMHITADALIKDGKIKEVIIVGVGSAGPDRLGEYAQWDGVEQGQPVTGVGLLYEDFLLNDVKPFIDQNFRTLPSGENTALMGQSIGGLSALNIGFRHPDVFGKLALQSPYLSWGDNRLYELLSDGPYKEKRPLQLWVDVGSAEGDFVDMAAQGVNILINNGYQYGGELAFLEAPGGTHSERSWSERIENILIYFYGDIGKPETAALYADSQLSLSDKAARHIDAVVTYSSGFRMTDYDGSYAVGKPELLTVSDFGGGLVPLAEGETDVAYTTAGGLTASVKLTIVK